MDFLFEFAQGATVEIFDEHGAQELGCGVANGTAVAIQAVVLGAGGFQFREVKQGM